MDIRHSGRFRPLMLGAAAAFALLASSAGAANQGDPLKLGVANTINLSTTLGGNTAAPQLVVTNANTGAFGAIRAQSGSAAQGTFSIYSALTSLAPGANSAALRGENKGTNANGYGVWGSQAGGGTGVYGTAATGTGLSGKRTSSSGATGYGVFGSHGGSGPGVYGTSVGGPGVSGKSTSSNGVVGTAGPAGSGVLGQNTGNGYGVHGIATGGLGAVWGDNHGFGPGLRGSSLSGPGVYGTSSGPGVQGESSGVGVYGHHNVAAGGGAANAGVSGVTDSPDTTTAGIFGTSAHVSQAAVRGESSGQGGYGVYGQATGVQGEGVHGSSIDPDGSGVYGSAGAGHGVTGIAFSDGGTGVYGEDDSATGYGVRGTNISGMGVRGESSFFQAVSGSSLHNAGVYGETTGNGFGAYFVGSDEQHGKLNVYGDATITGALSVSGVKNFRIDDPLDPAHRYLVHASVESSEMMNVYTGNTTTDGRGYAIVRLPRWFQALNRDFRYQLTIVGKRGWNARVVKPIARNRFTIQSDQPNVQVSWQVTGVRHDPYAVAHPMAAEQPKPAAEQGTYVAPRLYGKPARFSLAHKSSARMERHRRR